MDARTEKLLQLADDKLAAQVEKDLDAEFIYWMADPVESLADGGVSGLVTNEGRVAVVLYANDDDFEVADWYTERAM
ncbi:hypothetical protein ACMX2H_18485 [Arthrobacter sulfonylureivorans]|uniref:hypothetical protein n=1 Tax=Arthrobacter sulfonylureivorans TaxID=2486855 RepID=UPI0039E504F6